MSKIRHLASVGVAVLGLALSAPAGATAIAYFENGLYVDMSAGQEGQNLKATLTGLGYTVNGFTGITAADFAAATAGVGQLVIPEMENRDLNPDLTAAARAALLAFVAGGGQIIQANYFQGNSSLPNAVFGWALGQLGSIGPTSLDGGQAAGTAFAGGPASLSGANAVEGVSGASLPGGGLNIYHTEDETSVFTATVGKGCYTYLGYDWFQGSGEADWNDVTGRALSNCGTAVPEPGILFLFVLGGFGLAATRRRLK